MELQKMQIFAIHTNGAKSVFSSGTYILSNSKPYGTHLKTGPGLSGGGNLANNVNVKLDPLQHMMRMVISLCVYNINN